jgi:hypothetical protein
MTMQNLLVILKQELRVAVFESTVLKGKRLSKRGLEEMSWKACSCYSSLTNFRTVRLRNHEWGRRGMHIGYWWECKKERDH